MSSVHVRGERRDAERGVVRDGHHPASARRPAPRRPPAATRTAAASAAATSAAEAAERDCSLYVYRLLSYAHAPSLTGASSRCAAVS